MRSALLLFSVIIIFSSGTMPVAAQGIAVIRADCVGLINDPLPTWTAPPTSGIVDGQLQIGLSAKNVQTLWGGNPLPPTIDCGGGVRPGIDVVNGRKLQWGANVIETVYTKNEIDGMVKALRDSDGSIMRDLTTTMRDEVYTQLLKNVQEEAWRAELVEAVRGEFQQQIDALRAEIAQLRSERVKVPK